MLVSADIAEIHRHLGIVHRRRTGAETWGLIPTMGFLHQGHLALVARARAENDRVAVSIFVNPAQFNRTQDLDSYPRDLDRDLDKLRDAGVDLVFTPTPESMYPPGYQTWVDVEQASIPLEGASRPGHFRGVATVVTKLFLALQPDRAYFGQKDAQQCVVVSTLVEDLGLPLEIVVCPTVRERDGLAMSSRNALLTPEQRAAAPVIHQALIAAAGALRAGEREGDSLRRRLSTPIEETSLAQLDYASIADPRTLEELEHVGNGGALLSMAAYFGSTRLIDNLLVVDLPSENTLLVEDTGSTEEP